MEIIVFLSIVIAVVAVLTSIFLVRRVKKQIAEMTDALVDVKNGNGNRRILSATNELTAPIAYEINEIRCVFAIPVTESSASRPTAPGRRDIPSTFWMRSLIKLSARFSPR